MIRFTWYELLWLFFIYSFLGWVLETAAATVKQKKFANRGLVNGPFCVIYGIAALFMTFGLQELRGVWLFLFAAIYATVIEWVAGHLIEKAFKARWWDYSKIKWNLDGYICIPASLIWGALGYLGIRWGNRFAIIVFKMLPLFLMKILVLVLLGVLVVDILGSYLLLRGKGKNLARWEATNEGLDKVSNKLGSAISGWVGKRIQKAYPKAMELIRKEEESEKGKVFAAGCGFYKIVLLFFVGAFLGDITETIFCRIKIVFGKVFWDYSEIPFNLGGRINLLYCFFWGIAAVVWFKKIYPYISAWIEKIPMLTGKVLTWLLIIFMVCNVAVSCIALVRYDERGKGVVAENSIQKWADEHYDDAKMEKIYPNAKATE
ncbi:MAG: putative ABC transporter permease [Clostridiales bacterium]|nr:putative ABC transporter permease [Clostridiales bacterium]